jgi:hypothetical protein
MRLALALLPLLAGSAAAARLEYAGTVTAASSPSALHAVGDAHYIALTEVLCPDVCFAQVLDVTTLEVHRIETKRGALQRFGEHGVVASYTPTRTGLFMHADSGHGTRYSYVEVDTKSGRIVRSAPLGTSTGATDIYFVGTDSERGDAWFSVEQYSGPRDPQLGYRRAKSATAIALRRIDLGTFAVTDDAAVTLAERAQSGPLEIQLFVHPADDFSRFAIVEYWEQPHKLSPAGNVYIVETATATSFSLSAPPVTYGAAFSRDGKYLYLSSAQSGTVSRVDLATHKIDQTVTGPKLTHHLAISPDDRNVIALVSGARYVDFDLPKISRGTERAHDKRLAPAFESLFGGGVVARYGGYVVLAQPTGTKLKDTEDYVVARVVK